MYKGVIFDLDGTLLNTIEDITDSINFALSNSNFKTYTIDDVKRFVGSGVNIMVQRALAKDNYNIDQFNKVKEDYMNYYEEHQRNKTCPYKGVIDVLKKLKENNIHVAVLSNKPHKDTYEVIKHYFGIENFNLILGQRDSIPIKPDPTAVFEIINQLGLNKNECLYVGDSDVDMKTAINAKMDAIGVTWGFRTKEELMVHNPKYLIHDAVEILNIVLKN